MIGTELLLYPLGLTVDPFLSWAVLKRKEVSREKDVLHDRCSVMEEGWKKCKSWSTRGMLGKAILWPRHGSHTHELISAVTISVRPV